LPDDGDGVAAGLRMRKRGGDIVKRERSAADEQACARGDYRKREQSAEA
jgi:hypothetical protein